MEAAGLAKVSWQQEISGVRTSRGLGLPHRQAVFLELIASDFVRQEGGYLNLWTYTTAHGESQTAPPHP